MDHVTRFANSILLQPVDSFTGKCPGEKNLKAKIVVVSWGTLLIRHVDTSLLLYFTSQKTVCFRVVPKLFSVVEWNKFSRWKAFLLTPPSCLSEGNLKRSIGMSSFTYPLHRVPFPLEEVTESPRTVKSSVRVVQGIMPGKQDNCWLLLLRVLARTASLVQDLSYIQLKVSLQSAQPWMQEHIFLSKFPFCFNNTYNPIFTSRDESCSSPTHLQWMEKSNHTYWFLFLPLCSCFFCFFSKSAISNSASVSLYYCWF